MLCTMGKLEFSRQDALYKVGGPARKGPQALTALEKTMTCQ
ncbi:unnamed protein product, partial [Didymodactylos carnosus]